VTVDLYDFIDWTDWTIDIFVSWLQALVFLLNILASRSCTAVSLLTNVLLQKCATQRSLMLIHELSTKILLHFFFASSSFLLLAEKDAPRHGAFIILSLSPCLFTFIRCFLRIKAKNSLFSAMEFY